MTSAGMFNWHNSPATIPTWYERVEEFILNGRLVAA
jgi:hypothetical protein